MTDEDSGRRPYPRSLYLLLGAVGAYLLQVPPFPGVILMFMMAVTWPMMFVYAAALGIVLEVIARQVSPWWLALPFVPLAAYEAEAARQHLMARREIERVLSDNRSVRLPFDPAASDLVVTGDPGYWNRLEPAWLLAATPLRTVYTATPGVPLPVPRHVRHGQRLAMSPTGYTESRASGPVQCEEIRTARLEAAVGRLRDPGVPERYLGNEAACMVTTKAAPGRPRTLVSGRLASDRSPGLAVERSIVTITIPDGRSASVSQIRTAPLSWIPYVLAGCGGELGGRRWECRITPVREKLTSYGLNYDLGVATLAQALGLSVSDRVRTTYDSPEILGSLRKTRRQTIDHAYEVTRRAIDDAAYSPVDTEVKPIVEDPERLRRIAPDLIAWTRSHIDMKRPEGQPRCVVDQPKSEFCVSRATMSKTITFTKILEDAASGPLRERRDEIADLVQSAQEAKAEQRESWRRRKDRERETKLDLVRQTMMTQQRMMMLHDRYVPLEERRRIIMEMEQERRQATVAPTSNARATSPVSRLPNGGQRTSGLVNKAHDPITHETATVVPASRF